MELIFIGYLLEMLAVKISFLPLGGNNAIFIGVMILMAGYVITKSYLIAYVPRNIVWIVAITIIYYFLLDLDFQYGFFYLVSRVVSLLFIGILAVSSDEDKKVKIIQIAGYTFLLLLVLSIVNPSIDLTGRSKGVLRNANDYGALGCLVILVFGYVPGSKKYFLIPALVLGSYAVIGSGSRMALAGMAFLFLFLPIKNAYKIGLVSAALLFASYNEIHLKVVDRLSEQTGVNEGREREWGLAMKYIDENKWIGLGLQAYDGVNKYDRAAYRATKALGAHSGYLALLMTFGIVIGSAVILLLVIPVWHGFKILTGIRSLQATSFLKFYYVGYLLLLMLSFSESYLSGVNEINSIFLMYLAVNFFVQIDQYKKMSIVKARREPFYATSKIS